MCRSFEFLVYFCFLLLRSVKLSITKSTELFKDSNWCSTSLESFKLSVQWLTLPNLLNASWHSDILCNVFSVSVVSDSQESGIVISFNEVDNSWISFYRKLFSTSSNCSLSFNIPISWGHFLFPSSLLDLWLISAKPKVLAIISYNCSKSTFNILSIFLSKFASKVFRSTFVAVILIGISFWFTHSSYTYL